MAKITHEIRNSDDLDHIFSLRPRITQIIHTYAHLVHEERQEAAVFIAEIRAQRLSEMEKHLMLSQDPYQVLDPGRERVSDRVLQPDREIHLQGQAFHPAGGIEADGWSPGCPP